jgi:hypothetical protein
MKRTSGLKHRSRPAHRSQHVKKQRSRYRRRNILPAAAYRRRGNGDVPAEAFNAPEVWHEPGGEGSIRYITQPAGLGFIHPVAAAEAAARIAELPARFTRGIEVVQFSPMTRKRALFPCYGMQWGPNIYLYPIEESLVELYVRPPQPEQVIEARMYGGQWTQSGKSWQLTWTRETIKDFYLNNVLIHEIGHVNDERNDSFDARERYANWFAVEYGFRHSRGRR